MAEGVKSSQSALTNVSSVQRVYKATESSAGLAQTFSQVVGICEWWYTIGLKSSCPYIFGSLKKN